MDRVKIDNCTCMLYKTSLAVGGWLNIAIIFYDEPVYRIMKNSVVIIIIHNCM